MIRRYNGFDHHPDPDGAFVYFDDYKAALEDMQKQIDTEIVIWRRTQTENEDMQGVVDELISICYHYTDFGMSDIFGLAGIKHISESEALAKLDQKL